MSSNLDQILKFHEEELRLVKNLSEKYRSRNEQLGKQVMNLIDEKKDNFDLARTQEAKILQLEAEVLRER